MSFNSQQPYREIPLNKFGGLYTEADPRDLPLGASDLCHDVEFKIAGVSIRPGLSLLFTITSAATALYFKTMQLKGMIQTLVQDSLGALFKEDLSAPGVLASLYSGILNAARALSETVNFREYITLSDFAVGSDQPRQWDGTNLDRISQIGPGLAPIASFIQPTQYPIHNITPISFATIPIWHLNWGAYMIDATPPPGNNIYCLGAPNDTTFLKDLKVGDLVYLSLTALSSTVNPDGTYRVASVGIWNSDQFGGSQQFFSVVADQIVGQGSLTGAQGYTGRYQRTRAVVRLDTPIPLQEAVIGKKITISDCVITAWDGTWKIVDTPTEGQLLITATSLTANLAQYTYKIVTGNGPAWQPNKYYPPGSMIVTPAGSGLPIYIAYVGGTSGGTQPVFTPVSVTDGGVVWNAYQGSFAPKLPVTVFNCNNGNGIFNIQKLPIVSAVNDGTGGGSFTVAITSANIVSAAEQGSAVSGSGTVLMIDPGEITLNSGHPGVNPIGLGVNVGDVAPTGYVTPGPEDFLAAGQRYALCFFLTRNGYLTPASPPVSFYTNGTTAKLEFKGLPLGPSNVIARIVAMTGANSGIGGPYFWIPTDVILQSPSANLGAKETINKTVVNDNTSDSTGLIQIYDSVLLNSLNVSREGNNLQQQRELGESVKAVNFAGRVFYQGERVKTDNFVNLTFDGGTLSAFSNPTPPAGVPAGWTLESGTAVLVPSTIFGQMCQLDGTLSQGAYVNALKAPIIVPNTKYSVRVTAKRRGIPAATLTVELFSGGTTWPFIPTVTSTSFQEFVGSFNMNPASFVPVPTNLLLKVIGSGVDVDRIEVFPSDTPAYRSQLAASYADNPEAVDGATGAIDVSQFTSEPITNHYRYLDSLYIKTLSHTFSTQDEGREPAFWEIKEISNSVGCFGPLASDVGEEFVVEADRAGVYIFDGGNHMKISREIQAIWDSLYLGTLDPSAPAYPGKNIWVKNDRAQQRILVGVPLPTPNRWLPQAASNPAPSLPNVVLCCNYVGLASGREIAEADAVSVSQFSGHLLFRDRRRKWTLWQIPSPFMNLILRPDSTLQWLVGRSASGDVCKLDSGVTNDNTAVIKQRYRTFGFSEAELEQQLQLGSVRKIFCYATTLIEGAGSWKLTALPETPGSPYSSVQAALPLSATPTDDVNIPLNETGNRLFLDFQNSSSTAVAITAVTNANPTELTVVGHGLVSGNSIRISGATGAWVAINGTFVVTVTGANAFTIPVNATAFGVLTGSPVYDVTGSWFNLLRVVLGVAQDPRIAVSGR